MFKRILLERADFQLIASDLVKYYKVKSKIKFGASANKADYNWMTDTIRLRSSYSTVKELVITILHEIKHAIDAKKMGAKKYEREYQKAGEIAIQKGKDFHDDNSFEEKAEKWARKEAKKWIKKYK